MVETTAEAVREALEYGRVRKVLAVRASRLGDLLFTTPALAAFRARWPEVEVLLLGNRYSAPLLERDPAVDRIILTASKEAALAGDADLVRRLRHEAPALLLALRPRVEHGRLAEAAGIPFLFPEGRREDDRRDRHVVEQCFDRLAPLGLEGRPGPMRVVLGEDELAAVAPLLPPGEGPLVHVHPGCDETIRWKPRRGVRRRVWPPDHWAELLRLLHGGGARLVVSSGSALEGRWVERILAASGVPARHLARLPLRQLAAVAARADLVVSVDTGPLHVAAAVGTPQVALYGPSPVAYTGPWGGRATVLRRDLPCAPCQGRSVRCLQNVCMLELGPAEVLDAARARIAGPS
ncbi:MAG: glycosyltransferase family 9 protein [Planctomycetota bacterium]